MFNRMLTLTLWATLAYASIHAFRIEAMQRPLWNLYYDVEAFVWSISKALNL